MALDFYNNDIGSFKEFAMACFNNLLKPIDTQEKELNTKLAKAIDNLAKTNSCSDEEFREFISSYWQPQIDSFQKDIDRLEQKLIDVESTLKCIEKFNVDTNSLHTFKGYMKNILIPIQAIIPSELNTLRNNLSAAKYMMNNVDLLKEKSRLTTMFTEEITTLRAELNDIRVSNIHTNSIKELILGGIERVSKS